MLDFVLQGGTPRIPVRVVDTNNTGVSGLAFNAAGLTAKLTKGGASAAFTLSGGNWAEGSDGLYWVTLAAGDTDTLGSNALIVLYSVTGSVFVADFTVRGATEAQILSAVSLGATASALTTVGGNVSAIKTVTDALPASVALLSTAANLAITDGKVDGIAAKTTNLPTDPADQSLIMTAIADLDTVVDTKASQASVDMLQSDLTALRAVIDIMDDNGLTRMTVLTRNVAGAPLTATVYRWDTKVNYDLNTATGRTQYNVVCTYHASGHIDTFSKARA